MFLSTYRNCYLFLRHSSFFLSFHLLAPRLLHSCTFELFEAIPLPFSMGFWWLRRKKKSPGSNPTWKVVRMTWSLVSSTYSSSLLNQVTYYLSDSPSACWMLRRWQVGFFHLCPLMKWRTKPLLSCSKFAIVLGGILLNHTLATPFSIVGNALHITLFGVICNNFNILNDLMWSKGSLKPSYDSNCGRRNFDRKGRFSTSVVNGESLLQIISSKFSPPLSFMALFNSSISFLMLRSSFSILEESSPKVLSRLLAWEFYSSSFWFLIVHQRSAFWIPLSFAALHSSESTLPH